MGTAADKELPQQTAKCTSPEHVAHLDMSVGAIFHKRDAHQTHSPARAFVMYEETVRYATQQQKKTKSLSLYIYI